MMRLAIIFLADFAAISLAGFAGSEIIGGVMGSLIGMALVVAYGLFNFTLDRS